MNLDTSELTLQRLEKAWDTIGDDCINVTDRDMSVYTPIRLRSLLARAGFATTNVWRMDNYYAVRARRPKIGKDDVCAFIGEKTGADIQYPNILEPEDNEPEIIKIEPKPGVELSVILIAHGRLRERTIPCMSWLKDGLQGMECELVCVDDGSNDETYGFFLTQADIAIHAPKRMGICSAYNAGLQQASGKYVCLLQNDFAIPHGIMIKMMQVLRERDDIGLICPTHYRNHDVSRLDEVEVVSHRMVFDFLPGWCNMGRKADFEALGRYDNFIYNIGVDQDMSSAYKQARYNIARLLRPFCFLIDNESTLINRTIYSDRQAARRYASMYYRLLKWNFEVNLNQMHNAMLWKGAK